MSLYYKKRWEAVFLVNHPSGRKLSVKSAAKVLRVSESFVRKWIKRYKETGNVDDFEERGKKRKTTPQQENIIERVFDNKPSTSLRSAEEILKEKNINVSRETIRRRLAEKKIKYKSAIKKPLLTAVNVEKRLNWARQNVFRDWKSVVFTDESTFRVTNTSTHLWTTENKRHVVRTVKHPQKLHVYGCFCAKGFGKLTTFTGNLTAERMVQLYEKVLLPSTKHWFGETNRSWVLQEDNDPKHKSRMCTQWKAENGIQGMEWPPQSPDCNPIENVWGLLKQRIRGKNIRSIKHLSRVLHREWSSLSIEYAQKLSESSARRCERVIDNAGDWTIY